MVVTAEPQAPAQATVQIITPMVAKEWLAKSNNKNRKITESKVAQYADDMASRRWQLNGETIVMSKQGNIINGQHRLLACVRAGVPFTTLVASGIDEEAFETIDSGKGRSAPQVLDLLGYGNTTELASIARALVAEEKAGNFKDIHSDTPVSIREILRVVEDKGDEIADAIRGVMPLKKLVGQGSALALAWIAFGRLNKEDRNTFFARLADGEGLTRGSPILALRNLLINMRTKTRGGWTRRYLYMALLIKAWNAYRAHAPMNQIGFSASEDYPEPI